RADAARVAHLAAVAQRAVVAGAAGGRRELAAGQRIAAVIGTRVVVVAGERRARLAGPRRVAHLAAVAQRGVVAGAAGDARELAAGRGVAGVVGADVVVVAGEGGARRTDAARVAHLTAVAHGPVVAGTARDRRELAAGQRIAAVIGTRVVVVAGERRARLTGAR